jgi:hypothetical protein
MELQLLLAGHMSWFSTMCRRTFASASMCSRSRHPASLSSPQTQITGRTQDMDRARLMACRTASGWGSPAQELYRQPCWITKSLSRASSDRLPPWSSQPRPLKRPPSARRRCGRMTAGGSGRYVWFECSCSLSTRPVRGLLCSIAANRNAAAVPYMSYAAGIMFQASNRHRFALQEVGFLPRARANGSRHCRPSRIVIG